MLSDGQKSKLESQGISVENVADLGFHIDSSLVGLRKLMTFLIKNNFQLSASKLRSLPSWQEPEPYNQRPFIVAPVYLPTYSNTSPALVAYFERTPIGESLLFHLDFNHGLSIEMPQIGLVRLHDSVSWSIRITKDEQKILKKGEAIKVLAK